MKPSILWSLRLGFSARQAEAIEKQGLSPFLKKSFKPGGTIESPDFFADHPKTLAELKDYRKLLKSANPQQKNEARALQRKKGQQLQKWWLDRMESAEFPLREKMTCFWHNHFVSTLQKVKNPYFIFQHYKLLWEGAFGNFRQLTKDVLRSNAMLVYLDNVKNKKGNINENLARELLELFSLGIGRYTEHDVRAAAKALAGLNLGDDKGTYRKRIQIDEAIEFLGQEGNFEADDIVDIIFEESEVPYLITGKILQWFLYDNPEESLVRAYGDYLREVDFEMRPFLTKIFMEESKKDKTGEKIKDPLTFILQLKDEFGLAKINNYLLLPFLTQQGMELFNQPNVKGWEGGRSWLTAQVFLQRQQIAERLLRAKKLPGHKNLSEKYGIESGTLAPELEWDRNGTAAEIIDTYSERLLFEKQNKLNEEMERILPYDFDPKSKNAGQAVARLVNYIIKTPEFQLV